MAAPTNPEWAASFRVRCSPHLEAKVNSEFALIDAPGFTRADLVRILLNEAVDARRSKRNRDAKAAKATS